MIKNNTRRGQSLVYKKKHEYKEQVIVRLRLINQMKMTSQLPKSQYFTLTYRLTCSAPKTKDLGPFNIKIYSFFLSTLLYQVSTRLCERGYFHF